jgi:hypothetical protein
MTWRTLGIPNIKQLARGDQESRTPCCVRAETCVCMLMIIYLTVQAIRDSITND